MTHKVAVTIGEDGAFRYNLPYLEVKRGDKIRWKLEENCAFAVFIKALDSPLDWSAKSAKSRKHIYATVRSDATVGFYAYGIAAHRRDEILLDDPGLIVRR